jgi:hypothetical protein
MTMLDIKPLLLSAAVAALLVAPGSASAAVIYNGHAGLGASVYQHNQTDLEFLMADMGGQFHPRT